LRLFFHGMGESLELSCDRVEEAAFAGFSHAVKLNKFRRLFSC
jgi:hypothetical protein